MPTLPYSVYRAEQIRHIEQYVIETLGISGTVLMERAGAAAFAVLQQHWPKAKRIVLVCGTGHNGGDGYILARLCQQAGQQVSVLQVGDPERMRGDTMSAAQRLQSVDVTPVAFADQLLPQADLIVDALLGTGLNAEVSGDYAKAIRVINQSDAPVLALDIPSGLHADTGTVRGIAVKASLTISFLGMKLGLYTGDGPDYVGELAFDDLSVPARAYHAQIADIETINYARLKSLLKPRSRVAHKGHFGHVMIIGGESGMTGAVRMAGEAALRTGAGLVSIATRQAHAAQLNITRPELMAYGVETEADLDRLCERASVIAIGPGLGQGEWGQRMFKWAIESELPLLVDADALNLLALMPQRRDHWVLTPHAAEAARMLGKSSIEVHQNRFAAVSELQNQYGGIVVLKGAGTLIAMPEKPQQVCSDGNPGMASGGMGDVLTGVLAGLIAQGLGIRFAVQLGVVLHAAAGDAAAKAAGERGLLATDLMSWIRRLANP